MNFRIVRTILKKELLDTIRDKRTLIMMIGVPIVLYPAMLILGMQGLMLEQSSLSKSVSKVALITDEPELVGSWFSENEKIEILDSDSPKEDLAAGKLESVIQIEGAVQTVLDGGGSVSVEVLFDSTESTSGHASRRVRDGLEDQTTMLLDLRLKDLALDESYINPLGIERIDIAPPAKTTGNLLGSILPLIMIMMLALGAFYPAVDVTAGEKERGTFETLLSTPTSKLEIVAGKFLTVFILAMTTGLLNLASMAATFAFMFAQLKPMLDGAVQFDIQFPPSVLLFFLLILVPLAFFISAIMMCIAVFAHSFKEAQNYLTPFIMLILLPATFASWPSVKLTATTQFLPIANVVLLFRELMMGTAQWETAIFVFLSTVVFAVLALLFAAWLFQREEVILAEGEGFPLTWRRAEFRPRESITAAMAMGMFSVMLILLFIPGSLVQQWKMHEGLLITEWLLVLAPVVLFLWYFKVDIKKSLHLRPVAPMHLLGTLILGGSAILLVIQLSFWQNLVLPAPEGMEEITEELFAMGSSTGGVIFLLFVIALSPAICEEVLFRGPILSGLRTRLNPWASCLVVGILFGMFHLSIYRFLPTAVLGVLLTYLTVRTGSIYASMLLHFINNALAVLLQTESLPEFTTNFMKLEQYTEQGLPVGVLTIAVVAFVVGLAIVERTARRQSRALE
ncbi:MAG: ABC transporter permease subunit [Candidatus Hydrogenedentes bacterium]|nr:ABC transporter permease subunit [Candidatus Hydrogenedentota bacterium]